MATKVLVFESDTAFAGELRTELGRLGLVAQVVDDGYAGLMAAASEKPDLILLSIELPRMNGFSVCNKLKKDPALKDVPLIIMSSESSDDTFEQHRRLRTRAEDYVHKPIAFGELLEHMRPFVPLENGSAQVAAEDAAILIDDSELTTDTDANGASAVEAQPVKIDAEVEAFANTAFDRLLEGEALRPPESDKPTGDPRNDRKTANTTIASRSSMPPRPVIDAEVERLQSEVERHKTETARLERELTSARAEVRRLQDEEHRQAASNEQVARLERELDEIRLKAASGQKVAGVSSREFLDLREGLNKKEKEILGLRDQITRKEKELLDASDTGLALERDKADLEDKIGALDKEVQSAKSLAETAKADKEQAAKRAEDFKTRGEKTKAELEAKLSELATIQKRHEEEVAVAVAEVRAAEQRAREEALAALREEAEAAKSAAVAARQAELQRDSDERLSALAQSNEAEQVRLKGELGTALEEGEAAKRRLSLREAELEEQHRQAILGLKSELEEQHKQAILGLKSELEEQHKQATLSQRSELEARHSEQLRETETQHAERERQIEARHADQLREVEGRAAELSTELLTRTEEREVLAREVSQLKERVARLEADLGQRKIDLAETREQLAEQTQKFEAAQAKWAENKASFEQAKDALAAAVAHIEEAQGREI